MDENKRADSLRHQMDQNPFCFFTLKYAITFPFESRHDWWVAIRSPWRKQTCGRSIRRSRDDAWLRPFSLSPGLQPPFHPAIHRGKLDASLTILRRHRSLEQNFLIPRFLAQTFPGAEGRWSVLCRLCLPVSAGRERSDYSWQKERPMWICVDTTLKGRWRILFATVST